MAKPNTRIVQRHGDDGWEVRSVSPVCLKCLVTVVRWKLKLVPICAAVCLTWWSATASSASCARSQR